MDPLRLNRILLIAGAGVVLGGLTVLVWDSLGPLLAAAVVGYLRPPWWTA